MRTFTVEDAIKLLSASFTWYTIIPAASFAPVTVTFKPFVEKERAALDVWFVTATLKKGTASAEVEFKLIVKKATA